jgi:hypothetical protein
MNFCMVWKRDVVQLPPPRYPQMSRNRTLTPLLEQKFRRDCILGSVDKGSPELLAAPHHTYIARSMLELGGTGTDTADTAMLLLLSP